MTSSLQSYLRMADLPSHFTMHSFRVGGSLSKSLTRTAVDEIMKIGGWKTEPVAKYYIGATRVDKCGVARRNAARATRTLASYHCRRGSERTLRHVWVRTEFRL